MARLRPLLPPIVLILISAWFIYEHWIVPDPHFRWPKAEAFGPIGMLIGLPYFGWMLYRAIRPLKLAVGMRAYFLREHEVISGQIVALHGEDCILRNERGDWTVNRYQIEGVYAR